MSYFVSKGIKISKEDIDGMLIQGGIDHDGLITLDEFKLMAKKGGSGLDSGKLWETVQNELKLRKGSKAVFHRLKDLDNKTKPTLTATESKQEVSKETEANKAISDNRDMTVSMQVLSPITYERPLRGEDPPEQPKKRLLDMTSALHGMDQQRQDAIRSATAASCALAVIAIIRKVVFKV
jgi:hypothetical protein